MLAPEVPISKTKIILPKRRAELVSRRRLLDILYERLDRRLILVSAPAGYGKTSLLIDLAHHSELPFCWLALDPLDRDPQRFIGYLIAALAERFPRFGNRSRSALNGLTNLEEGVEALLVTLVNEIHDAIAEHFVLVLDDFHFLDEAQVIYSFVNRFVQLMDENCHVILSSRTLPELPDIPLLVARDEVGGLDFSDLSFHPDEIQALLAQNQGVQLSDEEARRLADASEGWITGVQFADVSLLKAGENPFRAPRGVGVSVFDYLGQQVLDQQPEDLQQFLLRSSLLGEFDAALCEAVLSPLYHEPQDWPRRLETIIQKSLFALPVGADGRSVRYHHLFRDYLQARFRRDHEAEVTPMLLRLAQFHEARDEWEAAYQIYKQLSDTQALADLIERAGIPMYRNALLTVESWLNDLPPSLVRRRPGLLSLRGAIMTMRGRAAEGVRLLDDAIRELQAKKDAPALALALVRRGNASRVLGNYKDAIQDAAEIMKIAEAQDDLQALYADALRLRGLSLYRQGRSRQAMDDLEAALEIYERVKEGPPIPHLLMDTGMVHAALGEYRKAKVSYEKALEIWRQTGNLFNQANLLNNLGFLQYQIGEYETAAQSLEEGLLCAQQSGYTRMEALISISMGDLYSEIEDFPIAGQNYVKADALVQKLGDRFLSNYLRIAEANLALLEGQTSRARAMVEQASTVVRAGDSGYEYGHYRLASGRLAMQQGEFGRALAALADAKDRFRQDGREMETNWSSIWLAAAYYRDGQTVKAMDEMKSVLQKPNQVSHSAVVAARQASEWLEGLRNDREHRALLRGLFERTDRLDDQLPGIRRQLRRMARTIEIPAPTIAIQAFGRAQVWVNGRLLSASDWQTQAVRELFFYFLAMNKPVTKEQVGAVLWPDTTEPARLKLRFKNEIYRLRRAIGQGTILYEDEYYQLNPAIDHEYDVEAFEAYLAGAKSAALPADQIIYYQKAVELVRGPYLEDLGALWVAPERERLQQAFLSAALALAELDYRDGKWTTALQVCQKVLEKDGTCEAAYRLSMQIYSRMGDKAALIRTYRRCEESMRDVFGLPPSEDTQSLYKKLVS